MKPNFYGSRHPAALATPAQVQLIKMGQRALGIDDETYRDTLWVRYQVTSSKDLNQEQVTDLLDDYKARGFEPVCKPGAGKKRQKQAYPQRPPRSDRTAKVVSLPTRDEIDKLNAVAGLIYWRVADGLALFLAKRLGIKDGKVRTSEDAFRAIEGLKKMFENGMKKAHGPNWWVMTFEDAAVMTYIREHCPKEFR
jgi:hypothetical protein